jgi:short subunit fatty acids transporter
MTGLTFETQPHSILLQAFQPLVLLCASFQATKEIVHPKFPFLRVLVLPYVYQAAKVGNHCVNIQEIIFFLPLLPCFGCSFIQLLGFGFAMVFP